MALDRRHVLALLALAPAAACEKLKDVFTVDAVSDCPGMLPTASLRYVDVHCHIHNLLDLPLADYVGRVFVPEHTGVSVDLPSELLDAHKRLLKYGPDVRLGVEAEAIIKLLTGRAPDLSADEVYAALGIVRTDDLRKAAQEAEAEIQRTFAPISSAPAAHETVPMEATTAGALDCTPTDILAFARQLMKSRTELATWFEKEYGFTELFTPAITEFELNGALLTSAEQHRAQRAVARFLNMRTPDADGQRRKWHPFAGFHPGVADAFTTTMDAINDGFVGVKLYPTAGGYAPLVECTDSLKEALPRGFECDDFNERCGEKEKHIGDAGVGLIASEEMPPYDLKELHRVLVACNDLQIPVLVHCGPTNHRKGCKHCAHPAFWQELLRRPEYSQLRVCLGHFGGLKDLEFFAAAVRAVVETPRLYADLSFLEALLNRKTSEASRLRDRIKKEFAGREELLSRRLMYATDEIEFSIFPSDSACNHHGRKTYEGSVVKDVFIETLARGGVQRACADRRVFRENALEFLGVAQGKQMERLQKYYRSDPRLERVWPTWLPPTNV